MRSEEGMDSLTLFVSPFLSFFFLSRRLLTCELCVVDIYRVRCKRRWMFSGRMDVVGK